MTSPTKTGPAEIVTNGPAKNDVSRLPKWAQRRLEAAEREVEHWKRLAHEGPEDTDTFINTYDIGTPGRPLEKGASIRFKVGGRGRGFIEAKLRDGYVEIYADGSIAVQPQSSNVVKVFMEEWR